MSIIRVKIAHVQLRLLSASDFLRSAAAKMVAIITNNALPINSFSECKWSVEEFRSMRDSRRLHWQRIYEWLASVRGYTNEFYRILGRNIVQYCRRIYVAKKQLPNSQLAVMLHRQMPRWQHIALMKPKKSRPKPL